MFFKQNILKIVCFTITGAIFGLAWMRAPIFCNLIRPLSNFVMATKEVKVELFSMAFVTAPNKDVAKSLASGLGKSSVYKSPVKSR
jgi:hypothetical protein